MMDEEEQEKPLPTDEDLERAKEWLKEKLRNTDETQWFSSCWEPFQNWCNDQEMSLFPANRDNVWKDSREEVREEYRLLQVGDEAVSIQTWNDIETMVFPKDRWRITNILPKSGLVLVAGISGERKSWFVMEMMNALTTPRYFLHDKRFVTEGCGVLYIDCEMGNDQLQRRGKMLGFNDKHEHQMYFIIGDNLNFNDQEKSDLDDVIKFVEEKDVKVMIIDTFRAVAGGMKEEKAEEVRAFFKRFSRLKEMGVCVIFLDHFRKPSHFEGKTPKKEHVFASQDKVSNCEVLLMLRTEPGSEVTAVYQRKNRLGQEINPFNFRMEDTDINSEKNRITLLYDGEHADVAPKPERAMEIILEALEDGPLSRKEILNIVFKESKIGERTASDACRKLEELGAITSERKGRGNQYSLKPPETGDVEDKSSGNDDISNNTDAKLPLND